MLFWNTTFNGSLDGNLQDLNGNQRVTGEKLEKLLDEIISLFLDYTILLPFNMIDMTNYANNRGFFLIVYCIKKIPRQALLRQF